MRIPSLAKLLMVMITGLSLWAMPAEVAHATPRSSGGLIVWTHRAAPGSEHLMIARADGSHPRALTEPAPDQVDLDAQVSPNGEWVAYMREAGDTDKLRLVRTDGSADHEVTVNCPVDWCAFDSPTWLSDRRLAFQFVKGPIGADENAASAVLWTIRTDGTGLRRLSPSGIDGTYEDIFLRVARDGDYQTFLRRRNADGRSALFRSDRRGGHAQQLTPWDLSADVNDLSTAGHGPSKDLLVFESYGRGDPDKTFVDIATVPATCRSLAACTRQIHWLTDNRATGRRNANPQWSPDGKALVFTDRASVDVEDAQIWTQPYPRGPRHLVSVSSPNFDYRPTWGVSPRG